ncbi:hypothetical protein [Lacticaseibacillus mingshuiensis]|uniref:hypothetical protein n=1 Tax=Lacticaseibacillus mingshuiensis TaxID=2799574 RepID=UPI0019512E0C|nr:hypothetical protein [Lacticaseibacillus mingshuiensis]
MASQELELGEYIGNQRRVQGIPVQFFCAQTGLAHATYTRLVRGEADWRLGPLLRAFDTLALSWEDVEVRVENTMMPLATTAQHIIGELGAIAPNALSLEAGEDLQKYLLVHVHELEPEAYQLLSGAIALYRQPDRAGQTRQASALLIKLRNYSQWTGFERNLFYLISPWLPFSAAHQALLSRIRPDGVTLQQIGRLYLSRAFADGTPLERAQAPFVGREQRP